MHRSSLAFGVPRRACGGCLHATVMPRFQRIAVSPRIHMPCDLHQRREEPAQNVAPVTAKLRTAVDSARLKASEQVEVESFRAMDFADALGHGRRGSRPGPLQHQRLPRGRRRNQMPPS